MKKQPLQSIRNKSIPKRSIVFASLLLTLTCQSMATEQSTEQPAPTTRKKIGLVLGGGGALGISHIGVLRVLEEQRVPIDYICGTSMGAIIAGLYANGMSPDEIEGFLMGLDWNEVMTDSTPRRELFFRRKLEDQRYLLTMGLDLTGLKMGSGMAAGQKFNNLLQQQVQRSASITDYNKLPIPYRAVSTDLQSGNAYVMDHGNLAQSMRASMAVPGVFTPVEIDEHILIDGGIVNNLPVDVARSMGADIVIAVDVGAAADKVDPASLKNIIGILGRTYAIAQRPGQIEQFKTADIGVQPYLEGFSASQFSRVAELIPQGVKAAQVKINEFKKLSVDADAYKDYLTKQRRPSPPAPRIESVKISGNHRINERTIRGRIRSEPGMKYDTKTINDDLMRIYGIGELEQVLYQLEQTDADTGILNFDITEDPSGPNYLSVGLNLSSDFKNRTDWNILLSLTRRSINELGAEWHTEAVVGSTAGFLSEFYQPLDYGGIFFIAPTFQYRSDLQDLYDGKDHIAEYDIKTTELLFDFGIQLRHYAELRFGPIWGNADADIKTGTAGLPSFDDEYVGAAIALIIDRKDRTYFEREGYYLALKGEFFDENWGGGEVSYQKISLDFSHNYSINDHTMSVELQCGTDLDSDLPAYRHFRLGGPASFAGLATDQFRGSNLAVGSLGYRYRIKELPSQLGRGIYAFTRGDLGNVWEGDINSTLRYGGLVGIGVDLNVGPLYLTYGLADGGFHNLYFSFGSQF